MCEHREHRTGNCRICWSWSTINLVTGEIIQPIDMPQLWDGDDS